MQKPVYLFMICILVAMLDACNLPVTTANAPDTATNQPVNIATEPPLVATVPSTEPAPTATQLPGPAVMLDQIHMLNPNTGWGWASRTGNMNQLLRTSDGGQTWQDVSPKGDFVYNNSFFLDAQTAWLPYYDATSNTGGILRTTDGGQTWVSLPSNDNPQYSWIKFSSINDGVAGTVDVGAGNAYLNYYQTQDGGRTWKSILLTGPKPETGLPAGTIHLCNICGDSLYYDPKRVIITYGDLASDPTGAVRLTISSDLGKHWKNLKLALPNPKYAAGSVAPQSPVFFGLVGLMPVNIIKYNQDGSLAFSVLAMYTSQDGGQSWQASPAILENVALFATVQIFSAKDAIARCGANLCSTNDGAQTWQTLPQKLNFGQAAPVSEYVSQLNFIDPMNGWAITGESGSTALWKSADGGVSWTKLAPTLSK